MCKCGSPLGKNGRKGMCSPCYRKDLYQRNLADPTYKERRNAYLRQRRASGKGGPSREAQDKRNLRQRERRQANPEATRVEKYTRRANGGSSLDYVRLLLKDPCSYCFGSGGTIDHIIPVAMGGTNDWWNLTSACKSCNSSKGSENLLAFLLRRV